MVLLDFHLLLHVHEGVLALHAAAASSMRCCHNIVPLMPYVPFAHQTRGYCNIWRSCALPLQLGVMAGWFEEMYVCYMLHLSLRDHKILGQPSTKIREML